jgi:hypothetical protein
MFRKGRSELLDYVLARLANVPVELHPGGLEDSDRRIADLGPDAIPRNQRYRVPRQGYAGLLLLEIVSVDLDKVAPLLWDLVLWEDGIDRARIHAGPAIDALVRVYVVHRSGIGGVNTVHGTDLDT